MKQTDFVTYAHRGASHYCPENTMMAFYAGMQMGANGMTVNFPNLLLRYIAEKDQHEKRKGA